MNQEELISLNNINYDKSITFNKLRNWGLTNIVKREIIIDELISKFPEPTIEEKNILFKNFCINSNIKSKEDLNNWQKNQGISNDQWQNMVLRRHLWLKWCRTFSEDKRIRNYF